MAKNGAPKITTGANDRPRDETIAQTGPGLPDDSGQPIEADEADIEKVRERLAGLGRAPQKRGG